MLRQVAPPEWSTGHQGSQCSSEEKPLQIFQRLAVKPLKYQSTKTNRGGEKGQGSDAHAMCQYLERSLTFEWCKKITPVIQSLMKNMPEVTFVTVSYTCLMVFPLRYHTSNLPLKSESWHVPGLWPGITQHFMGFDKDLNKQLSIQQHREKAGSSLLQTGL